MSIKTSLIDPNSKFGQEAGSGATFGSKNWAQVDVKRYSGALGPVLGSVASQSPIAGKRLNTIDDISRFGTGKTIKPSTPLAWTPAELSFKPHVEGLVQPGKLLLATNLAWSIR